jgi:hypothetical protein
MKRYLIAIFSVMLLGAHASAQSQSPNIAWGVNAGHQVYHLTAAGWVQVPPPTGATMVQVSVSPTGAVWGLDQNGNIYAIYAGNWSQMYGALVQISVGSSTNIWGVNASGNIYQWNGSVWTLIPNTFSAAPKQVAAGSDGTVWAIDTTGNIYSYNGTGWQTVFGNLAQLSVNSGNNVWGVNYTNGIYQWNGSAWTAIASPAGATAKQVSVGPDGTTYLLDTNGNIYTRSGSAWQPIVGNLAQISAGLSDCFAYANPAITTRGTWSPQTNASAAAGGYLLDSNTGDTVTFKFSGDSVALYRLVDPNGGQASVTVDGQNMGTFDFYFPTQMWQVPAVLDHLGAGQHTLVLTVTGQNNPASAGHNIYIDTFGAPAAYLPTADQQTALSKVNFYRNPLASATPPMPPASLSKALDLAAQAASDYNGLNNTITHIETPGTQGFVGVGPADRAALFGYAPSVSEDAFQGMDAAGSVDGWVDTVYHRVPILSYYFTDIGFGLNSNGPETVMDFGSTHASAPVSRLINPYPVNGQANVPTTFSGGESPNPFPAGVTTTGYPISVQIAQPSNPTQGTTKAANTYQLTDSTGKTIPVYTLDYGSDPNHFLGGDTFFMLPQQPLNPATTYNAQISGADSQGNPFNVAWSFSTVPNAAVTSNIAFAANSNSVWIQWSTAGPFTSTSLVYGTTSAYGTPGPKPSANGGGPNQVVGNLTGLSPNTTYHYQITATDAQGNTWKTPDATFTTTP